MLRHIVKYQYTSSQKFFLFDLLIFIVFYVAALFLQFYDEDLDHVINYQISCFVIMVWHTLLEIIQGYDLGLKDYFTQDFWNYIDVMNIICYFSYFITR